MKDKTASDPRLLWPLFAGQVIGVYFAAGFWFMETFHFNPVWAHSIFIGMLMAGLFWISAWVFFWRVAPTRMGRLNWPRILGAFLTYFLLSIPLLLAYVHFSPGDTGTPPAFGRLTRDLLFLSLPALALLVFLLIRKMSRSEDDISGE